MSSNPDPPIPSPHDRFFKETFSHPELFAELVELYLPGALVQSIDWTTLKSEPGSFIDQHLSAGSSDLLYSAHCAGREGFLYCLFEHQSQVDPGMPFRLLRYMVGIWTQWGKGRGAFHKLPPIIPIVLHNGKATWNASARFLDCMSVPPELREAIVPLQPDFHHCLIDLSSVRMAQIRGGVVLHLALTLMKAAGEGTIKDWIRSTGSLLAELANQSERTRLFYTMMRYLLSAVPTDTSTITEIVRSVQSAKLRTEIMTIAEQLNQEGYQRGIEQGIEQGTVIGQIQLTQRFLGQPVAETKLLQEKPQAELQQMLAELEKALQERLN